MRTFLKNMFSGGDDVSSKRVSGIICILFVVVITTLSVALSWEIKSPQENLMSTIFWGGVVLLGATGVEKLIKK